MINWGECFCMKDLASFKNQIFKYGIIIAVLCQLISLPFLGLNPQFSYGLALGTAIAIVNFTILEFTLKKAIEDRKGSLAFVGYLIRLAVYGGAFYISMQVSLISGMATLIGFMTLKLAIYYLHGFKAKFSENRKVSPEVQAAYQRRDAARDAKERSGIRKMIKDELGFKEDAEFFKTFEEEEAPGKTYRKYRRRKLSK